MITIPLVLVAVAGYAAFIVAVCLFLSVSKKESSRP